MPENQSTPSNFKVVDRRTFTEHGPVRERESQEERAEPEGSFTRQSPASSGAATTFRAEPDELLEDEAQGFETLVAYLRTTAMFQLGLLSGPSGERIPADLENAR